MGEKRAKQNFYAISSIVFLAIGVVALCALFFALSTPIKVQIGSHLESGSPDTGELASYNCGYFGTLVLHGGQVDIVGDPPAQFTTALQDACSIEQKAPAVSSALLGSASVIFLVAAGVARHRGLASAPRPND